MIQDLEFENKYFLITGGSKGIGRSICLNLIKRNANIIFTYRKKDKSVKSLIDLNKSSKSKILCYQVKKLDELSLKKVLKRIKRNNIDLNFLINNIGDAVERKKFINSPDKLWISSLEINLMSAVRFTKLVLKYFNSSKLSSIINIGSIAGKTLGQGDSLHYGVAKAGLHAFTLGLSKELKNTRVNCVAPNAVDTNFQKRLSSKNRLDKILKKNLLGRLATVEEVSDTVIFLCSKKASYINGEVIYLTGGLK